MELTRVPRGVLRLAAKDGGARSSGTHESNGNLLISGQKDHLNGALMNSASKVCQHLIPPLVFPSTWRPLFSEEHVVRQLTPGGGAGR